MSRLRLPDEMLGRPAPARRPAGRRAGRGRSGGSRGPSPFRQGMILGICVGMTIALLFGALGFLLTRPTAVAPGPAAASAEHGVPGQPAGEDQPAASIDVTAQHLGDLQVRIEARVSAPGTYDPITKGQVFAYTDMVAMPMSHKQGPIVMAEVAGRPGTYQAVTQVPMIGEYNVTVEVRQPMASRADKRVDVQGVKKS